MLLIRLLVMESSARLLLLLLLRSKLWNIFKIVLFVVVFRVLLAIIIFVGVESGWSANEANEKIRAAQRSSTNCQNHFQEWRGPR